VCLDFAASIDAEPVVKKLCGLFGAGSMLEAALVFSMLATDSACFMGLRRIPGNGATGSWISKECRPLANRYSVTIIVDEAEYARIEALEESEHVSWDGGSGLSVGEGVDIAPSTSNGDGLLLADTYIRELE